MKLKRIISALIIATMLFSALPLSIFPIFAEKSTLEVKWNAGYIGSCTNTNKNKIVDGSTSWLYSDVITLPKAGDKISFTTSAPPTNSVSVFSSWKQSGNGWVFDPAGVTIMATASYPWVGQTKNGSEMTYEYVADKDNETIRICTKATSPAPVVYFEHTSEKSTRQILAEREFTATFDADGTVSNIGWMCGYAASASNTNGSAKEVKLYSSTAANSYAVSNLILVPKKGTEISYTIASSNNSAYNAFTRYKYDSANGIYVYDIGFEATDSLVNKGNTYTYITSQDNEVIRLCCRPNLSYSTVDIDPPVKVSWKMTSEAGTAASAASKVTVWPDPELVSPLTGARLNATEISVKWNRGYIGSQYHSSSAFAIAASSGSTYSYSDVITIPKAGTTIYFFDQSFTDYNGGMYASTSAMVISHWKQKGASWVIDRDEEYLNGCECPSADLDENYRTYYYTTKKDNENIRLCFLSATKYSGETPIYPPVYIAEPMETTVELTAGSLDGTLRAASYTDAAGKKTEFKYYIPTGYRNGHSYPLIFDTTADEGEVAKYFASKCTGRAIVVSFGGKTDDALRLLDVILRTLPVRESDILYVGGDELAAHASKYSKFRFCQALLYTGDGTTPKDDTYAARSIKEFATTGEAAEWLIGECEQFFSALEGITMYAIGDSYFGGSAIGQHLTWVNLLGNKYGMNYHNYGIGGNTVAECSGRSTNSPPMATRSTELPDGGDIYIVEGGRNDRHYNVPFGSNTSTAITTYTGAINTIISRIRKNNPDALIILVTPWSHKTESGYLGTNDDYADKMRELAEYHQNTLGDKNVICLYAAETEFTGINMSNPICRRKYCIGANDVSHLNPDGMNMIKPIFEKWIAEQYMQLKGVEAAPADTDPVITTPEPPETTESPTDDETTAAPATSGGCGSAVSAPMVAVMLATLICGAALVTVKKKEDR